MGSIFISYRRADSEGYAGRLWDHIAAKFGAKKVFMDVDSIGPGDKFPEILSQALESCDVLIAVIGANWVGPTPKGQRRIDEESDFVRQEVVGAIARGIAVIPVLVGGATLMQAAELPPELAALSTFNAIEVRHPSFNADVQRLLAGLDRALLNAKKQRRRSPRKTPDKQSLTPVFGITPGLSTRGDIVRLLSNKQLQALGKLKKKDADRWEFQFAYIIIAHEGEDYTANPSDVVYSIEYWGNKQLPLGFTTSMELDAARQIAMKHFVWLGFQDFRGLVFSNRENGPIMLEISGYDERENPLTYTIYGSI